MSRSIIYIIAFLSIVSCQSVDKSSMPKTLIEEDRMVELLTDIAFLKAAKSSNRKVFEDKHINPEAYILKKHGIDSIVFAENNAWYAKQYETYKAIFDSVKKNLEGEVKRYEKLKKEEDSIRAVKDSIAKIKDSIKVEKLTELKKGEELKKN